MAPKIQKDELLLIDHTLKLCLKENMIDLQRIEATLANLNHELATLKEDDTELYESVTSPLKARELLRDRTGFDPITIDKKKALSLSLPESLVTYLKKIWQQKEKQKAIADFLAIKNRLMLQSKKSAFIDLNYSKAVTHRWAGGNEDSQSYNIQNMSKNSGVREVWVPDDGHFFSIVDFAQIEVRVIAWFTGERTLLEQFRSGLCVYCEFGRPVFGFSLNPQDDNNHGKLRQITKQGVIGLSYGMGPAKFQEKLTELCPSELSLACETRGFKDSNAFARHIVEKYRETFKLIAGAPNMIYQAYKDAITKNKSGTISVGFHPLKITYEENERTLIVQLPTGSSIFYRSIESSYVPSRFGSGKVELQISYKSSGGRRKIIGYSTPIENVTQAMARDILGKKILKAEALGFDIRMHTHEEVIVLVNSERWSTEHKAFNSLFETQLGGIPDLPLKCTSFISDRYTKDEKYMRSFENPLKNQGKSAMEETCHG